MNPTHENLDSNLNVFIHLHTQNAKMNSLRSSEQAVVYQQEFSIDKTINMLLILSQVPVNIHIISSILLNDLVGEYRLLVLPIKMQKTSLLQDTLL